MSSALARLRKNFNDELLVRTHNQNHLTPLAERLAPEVSSLMLAIDSVVEDRMDFDPCTDSRSFTISADDYTATVLAPILRAVIRRGPKLSIHISRPVGDPEEALQSEAIDLLISTQEIPNLPSDVLFTDRNVVAVSADNPFVGDELTEDLYCSMPQVLPGQPLAESCGGQVAPRLTTSCYLLVPFLLAGGESLATFPERLSRLADWPSIRFLEPPVELPDITVRMYWHPRLTNYSHNVWLRKQLRKYASRL